jgi:hypothetical protein
VLLALALFMTTAAPAVAQPNAEAVEMRASRAFALWSRDLSTMLERANVVIDVFTRFMQGSAPNESRETFLTRAAELRSGAIQGRAVLAQMQRDLDAMQPFAAEGAPESYLVLSEAMLRDTKTYLDNLDTLLGLMVESIDALQHDDQAALQRIMPRLLQGMSYLIEGQIVTVRTRQQMVEPTESAYHSLGTMIALYEGMRAIAMPNVPDRAAAIIEAAQSASRWGISGRAALAQAVAELPEIASRERHIMSQMLALEEQFYLANDRVIEVLEAAAREVAQHGEVRRGTGYIMELSEIELRYQALTQQEIELFAQLTNADNPL